MLYNRYKTIRVKNFFFISDHKICDKKSTPENFGSLKKSYIFAPAIEK